MLHQAMLVVPYLAVVVTAQATADPYGQCGGIGFTGPSACDAGYSCTILNEYYYQCYPGAGGPTSSSLETTTLAPTATTSTGSHPTSAGEVTTTPATTTPPVGGGSGGGGSVPTTLQDGWYWVRAVASPNFHSYLQAKPTGTTGSAYLDSHVSAGQFKVADGQVVYNQGDAAPLYMNVENPVDKTQRKLQTWFNATENAYGAFAFQGDTLTWSVADINRPNLAAWLVCERQELFINTGAYLYETPAGCFDQTIHSYGGSTADL